MAFPEKLPDAPQMSFGDDMDGKSLRQQAVAIDPPPSGTIGMKIRWDGLNVSRKQGQ